MTLTLWLLTAITVSMIFLTRKWKGFPRVVRVITLYPLCLLLCFVLFARWQLRSTVSTDVATVQSGKKLFESTCVGCHSVGQGRRIGPDLKYAGDRYDSTVLAQWMINSDAVYQQYGRRPLSQSYPPMPKLGIAKKDAETIAAYIASLSQDKVQDQADGEQPAHDD